MLVVTLRCLVLARAERKYLVHLQRQIRLEQKPSLAPSAAAAAHFLPQNPEPGSDACLWCFPGRRLLCSSCGIGAHSRDSDQRTIFQARSEGYENKVRRFIPTCAIGVCYSWVSRRMCLPPPVLISCRTWLETLQCVDQISIECCHQRDGSNGWISDTKIAP